MLCNAYDDMTVLVFKTPGVLQRRPRYRQFISSCHYAALPPSSPSRRRRVIGAGRAGLQSLHPLVSLHGVGGVFGFLGSAIVTARLTSSSLYAGVRWSQSAVCFAYFCADNPTVRMSLFALVFFCY